MELVKIKMEQVQEMHRRAIRMTSIKNSNHIDLFYTLLTKNEVPS
jgi:hypothetical protein